jgi:hypothetical protein
MSGLRGVVVALVILAPAGAIAAGERQQRVASPGVCVVSPCHIVGYGSNEKEARAAFKRAVREARRDWPSMGNRCALPRLTDLVRIAPGQRPAFFVAGSRLIKGTDPAEVVRRCRQRHEAEQNAEPGIDFGDGDLTIETTHAYFAGGVLAHNY